MRSYSPGIGQSVVTAVFQRCLGVFTKNAELPDPLEDGRFWSSDDPMDTTRRLHPVWSRWAANASWVPEVVEMIKKDAMKYNANKGERVAKASTKELTDLVHTSWTSMKNRYMLKFKDPAQVLNKNTRNRRYNRKKTVSTHLTPDQPLTPCV